MVEFQVAREGIYRRFSSTHVYACLLGDVVFEAYSPALASLSYDNEAARKPQAGIVSVVRGKCIKKTIY